MIFIILIAGIVYLFIVLLVLSLCKMSAECYVANALGGQLVKCEKCKKVYNDFDHLTYCPHEGFAASPSYDKLAAEGKVPKYDFRIDLSIYK